MIKKHQKWIALLVVLTFAWLVQVSAMPLAAANVEQGPDYYEAVGQKASPAKKASILPVVLIGVGVVAVAAVLFLVVLKTNYDITGQWSCTVAWQSGISGTFAITFTGDKKSGSFLTETGNPGTYTVDKKNATWIFTSGTTYTGTFSSKTAMSGTMRTSSGSNSGTFTMAKSGTASVNPGITSQIEDPENKIEK